VVHDAVDVFPDLFELLAILDVLLDRDEVLKHTVFIKHR
jgi:hypothetical protein